MKSARVPFNIEILKVDKERTAHLRPVTSMDYFENVDGNLHDDGLFSIPIFGRMGDPVRDLKFSFIDIRTEIFHPVIYQRLCQIKGLYKGIMAGSHYAVWDNRIKDFLPSNEVDGQTGYSFFMQYWKEINFPRNSSDKREFRIKVVEKFRDRATVDRILVMPAGLRDIEIGDDGQEVVADINAIYRKILSTARTISNTDYAKTSNIYDLQRHMLQQSFNEIYEFIKKMLTGKEGFLQAKFTSRRVFNGTRNVITAMDTALRYLGDPKAPKYTDTIVGIHQAAKGLLPVTIHQLKNGFIRSVFNYGDNRAMLTNPKTLKSELVELDSESYDRWNTVEGLEKIINQLNWETLRSKALKVANYYLGLIYVPKDRKVFKFLHGIEELPEGADPKDCRPINLIELIYLSGYRVWNNYFAFVTRYPVTGVGSCFPASLYVKTTVVSENRKELNENWEIDPEAPEALEFPVYEPLAYVDSHIIHSTRLAGLGAD